HGRLVYEGEIEAIKANRWVEIGGDFSQNNIVQSLVEFGSVEVLGATASYVKISDIDNDKLADVVSYLTKSGYRIFRVARESETLEDIFLELTKEV
ncbi:TPA: ABC transporter ATP-binding protein, partial [Streptococcus suis]